MFNGPKTIFSNDLRELADQLVESLFFSSEAPFENRLVVVPDPSLKEFLFHHFAADPRLNIAAGLQVLPLNQAAMEILGNKHREDKKIPTFNELSLVIEEKLRGYYRDGRFPSLSRYLDGPFDKRAAALSAELARLFGRYGLYGARFLSEWLKTDEWQSTLFKEIFLDSPWTFPLASLKQAQFEGKIALFGFSYLPPAHLAFFHSLSAQFYLLSPSALFWEEVPSEKKRLKRGDPFSEGPALLGNWGKLKQEMLRSLGNFSFAEAESYREPESATQLAALKRTFLTWEESDPFTPDDSVQMHSAVSKMREVESLRDALETYLNKNECALRDILVLCSDIPSYAPYIQMVFAQSFPFSIEGIPLKSASAPVRAFLLFLQLPENRFDIASMKELFSSSPFMEKHNFSQDEVRQLFRWFEEAQIRGGLDLHPNSWEEGLDRLLLGLGHIPLPDGTYKTWPADIVPPSETDLFSRFLELFAAMQADLSQLFQERKAAEWFALLLSWADKYLDIDWERESFFQEIKSLARASAHLSAPDWKFSSIARILGNLAEAPSGNISTPALQKIRFGPLRLGHPPARLIWCLGMSEGVFPQSEGKSSLCEMSASGTKEYVPSKTDEGRALFLELFLKAEERLVFSYERTDPKDNRPQGPSLLIEECGTYLRKRSGSLFTVDHPAFPFDEQYFSPDAPVKKHDPDDYLAAQAHYRPSEKKNPFFTSSSAEETLTVEISKLKKLARDPLKFYFNETLKIYLQDEEDREEAEFLVSNLRKAILRKKAVGSSMDRLLAGLRAQGRLPRGMFQDAAAKELMQEVEDLRGCLDKLGIHTSEISSQQLDPPLHVPLNDGRVARIIGVLEDITPKGLLFHGDKGIKDLVKAWPLYLIYRNLGHHGPLLLTKRGGVVDVPLEDPKAALAEYISYYLHAQSSPSPFLPEWTGKLMEGDFSDFEKGASHSSYVDYLQRRGALMELRENASQWMPYFQVFSSLG